MGASPEDKESDEAAALEESPEGGAANPELSESIVPQPERTDPIQTDPSADPPYTHTRASGVWAAVVTSLLVLVVLIVFILENPADVHVDFFGAHGSLALGVALLLAAVIGGLVVVMFGTARILQLRHRSRRQHRLFTAKNAAVPASQ